MFILNLTSTCFVTVDGFFFFFFLPSPCLRYLMCKMRTITVICNNACRGNNYPLDVSYDRHYYWIIVTMVIITRTTLGDTVHSEAQSWRWTQQNWNFFLSQTRLYPISHSPLCHFSLCHLQKKGKKDEKASIVQTHIVTDIESSH